MKADYFIEWRFLVEPINSSRSTGQLFEFRLNHEVGGGFDEGLVDVTRRVKEMRQVGDGRSRHCKGQVNK